MIHIDSKLDLFKALQCIMGHWSSERMTEERDLVGRWLLAAVNQTES